MSEPTIEGYLAVASHFQLGRLPTECSNPITRNLSQLCSNPETVPEALHTLQKADIFALQSLLNNEVALQQTESLARDVHSTLEQGFKVVCEGCGATGRLSLSLEVFAKEGMVEEPEYQSRVLGFMAGGDAAFIRSIEAFEDRVEYGRKQLHEIGFTDGDLLLAITEGGETPFVIAACEEAVAVSPSRRPYFLYCNPDDVLCEVAERSKRVIENSAIHKINLTVGPMAITGSTRMQATTVQILIAGLAIRHHAHPERIRSDLAALLACVDDSVTNTHSISYSALAPFTRLEAELYAAKEYFVYETTDFSVTTMTDTTERAPTFSMPPFETYLHSNDLPSQVYLMLPDAAEPTAAAGWERLLRRPPRALEWEATSQRTGMAAILGYDISCGIQKKRAGRLGAEKTKLKAIVALDKNAIVLSFPHANVSARVELEPRIAQDKLLVNVVAKMLLNAHSTAVMGILQRYEGNVMTWVRPSNNKLIDRAARYVKLLLSRRWESQGADEASIQKALPSYEAICTRIYEMRETVPTDQPIVLLVVAEYMPRISVAATATC
mmetsp:Transcript_32125/g.37055  ORF Transcript_32125/g.37055 Transcript_32125/m.37055 type:complete len:553 (+) Transcript_32125:47-1705(+)|eukprot:CAMPEP_0176433884 /NCGR_PEP_ID=MMETSP0127-20121128/16322_1 /TAXON_ID=938130 /ORGANISM="Platyophrya macrostoma, Strain WH" /LENGTH=552 /DNA_ID=CAMNT_0017816465 /DNA_START=59 /DNA_END=1717 /DNA_ORIENTATION=+